MAKPKKRRDRPAHWALRPHELPAPALRRREPRLAGLADNSVYRMLQFERHQQRRLGLLSLLGLGVAALILVWSDAFWLLLLGVLAVGMTPRALIGPAANRTGQILGIRQNYYEDLWKAGYPARDMAIGLWGEQVRRAWLNWRLGIKLFWLTACLAAVVWPREELIELRYGLAVPVAVLTGAVVLHLFAPWFVLPALATRTRAAREQVDLVRDLFGAVARYLVRTTLYVLGAAALISAAVFAIVFLVQILEDAYWTLGGLRGLWIAALVALGLGAAGGFARGVYVKRRAEHLLDRIEQNLEPVLEHYGTKSERGKRADRGD